MKHVFNSNRRVGSLLVLLLLMMIDATVFSQTPSCLWAKRMGGIYDEYGYSIATDNSANVYTIGNFEGTVDFDPGAGIFNLTSVGAAYDIFISKLDASGNFLWVKQIGGTGGGAYGLSIVIDNAGNVYTTGHFWGTVDFNPGTATFNLGAPSADDIFICKLNTSGDFVWAKRMGATTGYDYGNTISIDGLDNVYVIGSFQGTVDFNPGAGIFNLTSAGFSDIFITKLDSSGSFLWAKTIGGASDDEGHSTVIDALGNVYYTGSFFGTVDFDPGPGIYNLNSPGYSNIFISKLDSNGNFIWAKTMSGLSNSGGNSIVADTFGNVYITGNFGGTVDFDPGSGVTILTTAGGLDIFISKLDSSGNFVWAKSIGGGLSDNGYSIALDLNNNIYLTGYFQDSIDFDPGTGVFNLISAGGEDIFISKLDASGNFVWAKAMGGVGSDECHSITLDIYGNLYVAGYFYSASISFGTITLTNADNTGFLPDIFISKLGTVSGIENVKINTGISVYPNPAATFCTITALSFLNSTLIIYDFTGRVLLQQKFNEQAMVNLAPLKSGIYLAELRDSEGSIINRKVVKE